MVIWVSSSGTLFGSGQIMETWRNECINVDRTKPEQSRRERENNGDHYERRERKNEGERGKHWLFVLRAVDSKVFIPT